MNVGHSMIASVALALLLTSMGRAQKDSLARAIDERAEPAWAMARQIWDLAEDGYQETHSAKLLADSLEKAGFRVERGVAKIPTAFTATIGQGEPVIGILGEYDALSELSQEAVPFRQIRKPGGSGHACGHHLFGVAAAEACVAIGQQIQRGALTGTLRFYGCPAEEGGAAKAFMVRAGLFKDCAAVLHWHPSNANQAGDRSSLARIAVKFRFRGVASHAAGSPEKGRSALDAVQLTCHAAELLREHVPDQTRIHHTITHGGGMAPNVVPEFAETFFYVRHPKAEVVSKIYPRLLKCAQAGALATETRLEVDYLGGTLELLPNGPLSNALKSNLVRLNDLKYDAQETTFAIRLQESLQEKVPLDQIRTVTSVDGRTGMGSTDVGDVSWVVPTGGFTTACWVPGTPAHSWQAVACGGTTIGKKGMLLAAKTLAATTWDLFTDVNLRAAARADFTRRLDGRAYAPLLEKDQPPPLNYRKPSR